MTQTEAVADISNEKQAIDHIRDVVGLLSNTGLEETAEIVLNEAKKRKKTPD